MNIWEPLLQGESRVSALNSIETIANEILRLGDEIQTPSALSQSALLFSYLSQEGPSGVYEQTIINLLNRAIGGVSRAEMRASFGLYGGLTGVGWIVEHVSQKMARVDDDSPQLGDEADEDDPLEEIDVALLARLRNGPEFPFYDLISGLVGFGVYFLQRLAHPAARQGLLEVLKLLKQKAEPAAIGITWHTPPEFLPAGQREKCPSGYYNLGVAHGVPGVIYLLGEIMALGFDGEDTKVLLEGTVNWLLAQRRPLDARTVFSSWISPDIVAQDSRFGWCYGDLGIAAVLYYVADRVGRKDWRATAMNLLDRCLNFPLDKTYIYDAGLCHGAVGVAHIFNRVFQSSKELRYKSASIVWFERALAMRKAGARMGGFLAYKPDQSPVWDPDGTFLSGGIGIALGL